MQMSNPLDVNKIENDVTDVLDRFRPRRATTAARATEQEHIAFHALNLHGGDRTLVTFVENDGYPILRFTISQADKDAESQDLILNNDQIKLLLRQMTLWLTR